MHSRKSTHYRLHPLYLQVHAKCRSMLNSDCSRTLCPLYNLFMNDLMLVYFFQWLQGKRKVGREGIGNKERQRKEGKERGRKGGKKEGRMEWRKSGRQAYSQAYLFQLLFLTSGLKESSPVSYVPWRRCFKLPQLIYYADLKSFEGCWRTVLSFIRSFSSLHNPVPFWLSFHLFWSYFNLF